MSTNGSEWLIPVAGVANVGYVLQSSTDLVAWTGIKSNLGAPFTFSVPATNGPRRFYRAAVLPAPSRRF